MFPFSTDILFSSTEFPENVVLSALTAHKGPIRFRKKNTPTRFGVVAFSCSRFKVLKLTMDHAADLPPEKPPPPIPIEASPLPEKIVPNIDDEAKKRSFFGQNHCC